MSAPLHKAGRALDALIAERVMGWTDVGDKVMYGLSGGDWIGDPVTFEPEGTELRGSPPAPRFAWQKEERVPDYSTCIAAAWLVVEKMRADGHYPSVRFMDAADSPTASLDDTMDMWRDVWVCEVDPDWRWEQGIGETAPLAICRAALRLAELRSEATPTDPPSAVVEET